MTAEEAKKIVDEELCWACPLLDVCQADGCQGYQVAVERKMKELTKND